MRVSVIGGFQTKFSEWWNKSLMDLLKEAGEGAMRDAKIQPKEIDLVVVGNKLGGRISGQDHLGALVASELGVKGRGLRVEAACASGGLAVHQAVMAIKAGEVKNALVPSITFGPPTEELVTEAEELEEPTE